MKMLTLKKNLNLGFKMSKILNIGIYDAAYLELLKFLFFPFSFTLD